MEFALIAALAGLIAFVVIRIVVRRWIVNEWLDERISNRRAAVLLGLTYLAPYLLAVVVLFVSNPGSVPIVVGLFLLMGAPFIALGGAVMGYMGQQGVREQLRKNRDRGTTRTGS